MKCQYLPKYFLVLAIFLFQSSAFSAAWVQPEDEWLLINNVENYRSCHFWNKSGVRSESSPCFEQFYYNPYFEYGWSDKLTVGINTFFWEISQGDQRTEFNLGSMMYFGRYELWQKNFDVISFQLGYNVPFLNVPNLSPTGVAEANFVSGSYLFQNYLEPRLMYGTGGKLDTLFSSKWFLSVEGAFDQAYDGAAEQWHFDMHMGWKSPSETWQLEFKTLNSFTLNNPSNINDPNFDLCTLEVGILYFPFKQVGIEVGAYQDVYGTNVGEGTAPFVSLWIRG